MTVSKTLSMTRNPFQESSTQAPSKHQNLKIKGPFRVEAHPNETNHLSHHLVTAGQLSSSSESPERSKDARFLIEPVHVTPQRVDSSCIAGFALRLQRRLRWALSNQWLERRDSPPAAWSRREILRGN